MQQQPLFGTYEGSLYFAVFLVSQMCVCVTLGHGITEA